MAALLIQSCCVMEEEGNDLNNNPHLRGANARFLAMGETPRLYIEIPPENTQPDYPFPSDETSLVETDSRINYARRHPDNWVMRLIARDHEIANRRSQPTVDLTGPVTWTPPPRNTPVIDLSR